MKDNNSAIALLIFSLSVGAILCLVSAACGFVFATQTAVDVISLGSQPELLIFVFGTAWCGVLLLPGAWFAYKRLQGSEVVSPEFWSKRWGSIIPLLIIALIYPVILFLGNLSTLSQPGGWIFPMLHIIAASIPVFWLTNLVLRQVEAGSIMRRWGLFGIGLTLVPGIVMVIEIGVVVLIGTFFIFQLSADQSQALELLMMVQRLQYAQADPEVILNVLKPYLFQPIVIYGGIAFIAGFVPLIEEFFKSLGIWLLAGRSLRPGEGFAAGIVSGAGYALFENLFITSPGSDWVLVSIGRIGTTTMHMLTAGILGYAFAVTWKEKKYLRLGGLYLLAALIHGAWNGLTIFTLATSLPESTGLPEWSQRVGQIAVAALILLYISILSGMVIFNRKLRSRAIIAGLSELTNLPANEIDGGDSGFIPSSSDPSIPDAEDSKPPANIS